MKFDLNTLLEQFNKLNDQMRYSVFGGVVFLILALDVFFLVLPQMSAISDVNRQAKKMSDDTQQVLADRARIKELKKNLEDTRLQLKQLGSKVRPAQEVPAILSTISRIANDYDVRIDQMIPEKSQQEILTKKWETPQYYALPVVIKALCGYHQFGKFLNKLENEDVFFIIKDFIIQNDEKDPLMRAYSVTIKIILVDKNPSLAKKP